MVEEEAKLFADSERHKRVTKHRFRGSTQKNHIEQNLGSVVQNSPCIADVQVRCCSVDI